MRKHLEGLEIGLGIMEVAQAAKIAKKNDSSVTNATIGMLYNNSNIYVFDTVKKIVENLSDEEKYAYGSSSGGTATSNAIQKHLLYPYQEEIEANTNVRSISTCGATASINFIIDNFIEENNSLIVSSSAWDVYEVICNIDHVNLVEYNMFEQNKFDITSFFKVCDKIYSEEKGLNILLNDPCNNPTGYTLSSDEWDMIIKKLVTYNNVNLILDTAYLAFSSNILAFKKTLLKLSTTNINTFVIFSASKTFALYGARTGGATLLSSDKKMCDDFFNSLDYCARGTYDSVPIMGCSIIQNIIDIEEYSNMYFAEIEKQREIAKAKSELFVKLAKENNIDILPHTEGFFVTINTNDSHYLYEKMAENGVFGVPLKCGYRIALCAIDVEDIPNIVDKLKISTI